LQGVLSNPVELLEWSVQGLPTDTVSQLLFVVLAVCPVHLDCMQATIATDSGSLALLRLC
jgi:hypothetical protein